jgi:UDPglucose 6-dehydrogenase
MREAPSLVLIRKLLEAGCSVRAYDPVASSEARRLLLQEHGEEAFGRQITLCSNAWEAVEGCDALALVTEWKEFRSPDFERLSKTLRGRAIFDGRNLYDPATVADAGLAYYGIGRRGQADAR